MKTTLYFLGVICCGLAYTSCSNSDDPIAEPEQDTAIHKTFNISSDTDDSSTRTTLSGYSVLWDENDKIGVFDGNGQIQSFSITSGAGTKKATIDGNISAQTESGYYYAICPYNAVSYLKSCLQGRGTIKHIIYFKVPIIICIYSNAYSHIRACRALF